MFDEKIEITDEDRLKHKWCSDSTIIAIKKIESLPDEVLQDVAYDGKLLEVFRARIGHDVNPYWVLGRVAEALYNRGLIDEKEFDNLSN